MNKLSTAVAFAPCARAGGDTAPPRPARAAPDPAPAAAAVTADRWSPKDPARALRLATVAGLHAALAVGGWQVVLRPDAAAVEPLHVVILQRPRLDSPAPELPRPPVARWQAALIQPPDVLTQRAPDPEPRPPMQPMPEPVTPVRPAPAEQPRVEVAAPPLPPPPPPAAPRQLSASAVAYLVPPPIELPLASRRLGEQGTVWLRVQVGADGLPRQVTLHKSSGFARLDEQALGAMRQARFKARVENGVAIEWSVIAPLQYEIS